jgi:pilus assembly protein CpaB
MRISTAFMFAVAFVCAGIAAFMVRGMINTSTGDTGVVAAAPAPKKIVVAAKDLKPGETLTADNLRVIDWAGAQLPKGAYASKDAVLKAGETRTLAAYVAENEPVLPGKLVDSRDWTLVSRVKDGMNVITIRVNDASGVGGFAQPEDRVDVLMTQTDREGAGGKAYTATLVRNVRVLAVDQQTQRKQQTQPPKTVTLEASPEDGRKLTLAQEIGRLSLVLTKGPGESGDGGVVDLSDLVQRSAPQPAAVVPAAAGIEPVVTVRGSAGQKEYKVPGERK